MNLRGLHLEVLTGDVTAGNISGYYGRFEAALFFQRIVASSRSRGLGTDATSRRPNGSPYQTVDGIRSESFYRVRTSFQGRRTALLNEMHVCVDPARRKCKPPSSNTRASPTVTSALAVSLPPDVLLPASPLARGREQRGGKCDCAWGCARRICSLVFELGLQCRIPRHVDADHAINWQNNAGRPGAQLNDCQDVPAPSRRVAMCW